jgi:hypothetical protein
MEQCREIFYCFFHESSSPGPLMIPAGPLQIFSKIRKGAPSVRSSRCSIGINDTGGKLATGVVATGGKFTPSVNNSAGHIFPEIYTDRCDTGGEFATGVKDTTLQRKSRLCIPFWELRGLSPNFYIHVSVSDLHIPRTGPNISL